jgi:hypothetical protein
VSRIAPSGGFAAPVFRSPELLALARLAPHCMSCMKRNDGTVVAAHSNQLRDAKGRGLKAHDYRIAFLDRDCHFEIDQGRSMGRQERIDAWEDAHRRTIGWLFDNGYLQVIT